jgi:hypothetical protein
LILQNSSESCIIDSIPVTEVKVLVHGLLQFGLGDLLGVLRKLFVIKIFGDILWEINKVFRR